jgi:putative flippase GtrA
VITASFEDKIRRWSRFIVGGLSNTVFTYLIYLGLSRFIHYQIAYFVAYCCGIFFAYWFNATFVFKVPLSWKGAVSYPSVYVIQYGASAVLLAILVRSVRLNASYAPLLVTACMLPLTYVMSKIVLQATHRLNKRGKADVEAANKL